MGITEMKQILEDKKGMRLFLNFCFQQESYPGFQLGDHKAAQLILKRLLQHCFLNRSLKTQGSLESTEEMTARNRCFFLTGMVLLSLRYSLVESVKNPCCSQQNQEKTQPNQPLSGYEFFQFHTLSFGGRKYTVYELIAKKVMKILQRYF